MSVSGNLFSDAELASLCKAAVILVAGPHSTAHCRGPAQQHMQSLSSNREFITSSSAAAHVAFVQVAQRKPGGQLRFQRQQPDHAGGQLTGQMSGNRALQALHIDDVPHVQHAVRGAARDQHPAGGCTGRGGAHAAASCARPASLLHCRTGASLHQVHVTAAWQHPSGCDSRSASLSLD
jgi:hypothetical protein